MTIEELIAEAKSVGKWSVDSGYNIRCENGLCPVVAVAKRKGFDEPVNNGNFLPAGSFIGLSSEDTWAVVRAADCIGHTSSYFALRGQLLDELIGERHL